MTRTYVAGEGRISTSLAGMREAVHEAMENVIDALGPGAVCQDLHRLAQESLHKRGWELPMPHALGHGVGLQLHERPYVSPASGDLLEAGMVLAIEPGVYDDGLGGYRVEDMFVITPDGAERLGPASQPRSVR
jgi:Xaa-Pro aminopeptidase